MPSSGAPPLVGIVALNIFLAVVLRKFFSTSIPDSYDIGKMLLGTLIFWGIAATSYRGGPHHGRSGVGRGQPEVQALGSTCSRRWCCCSS